MPAPTTTDEFLELVRKSGVADEKRLSAYLAKLRAAGPVPPEPAKVAGLLVRDGLLTHFQAEQVLQGKWRRFTIGKYKVLERLGAGGMGSVYLCEHKLMRRRVAVKVLPTAKADDPSSLERFYREARAVAALDHPNIVRAYDIDQDDKLHFLVMEYVDGSSLQEIIKKAGPMDVTRAAHYMRQSALGLQHAHESAGLVHRDIKPGNILVDRTGTVKILDMGLARFFHDEEDILTKKYDENVLGTADYLAPEQALDSHGVDIRADIYSLGATFYFCLTGRTPFTEGTVAQKLIWHQTRQPKPIKQTRPEVPDELAALIERMMSKDPAQRPQTPQEVADALAPFTQTPIGPPPEDEMPRLSPAALGLTGGEGGSSVSTPSMSSGPLSGQRKNWQVPTTPGSRSTPSTPSTRPSASSGSAASPTPPPPKPSRPNPPPSPSARVGAPQKVAAAPAKRAPAAAADPGAEEEGEPWQQLQASPDTEELAARADTPPQKSRKSSAVSARRPDRARLLDLARYERKHLLIVGAVAALVVGGLLLVVLLTWALSGNGRTSQVVPTERPVRQALRVGAGQKYDKVALAIRAAIPGDRILVQGPVHEEELVFSDTAHARKNLTIEADGGSVVWRTPHGAKEVLPVLVALLDVEGLKLRGFTFEGDNHCANVIKLGGKCPGTTLEDVTLQGFSGSGLVVMNCEGEEGRPVTLTNLKVAVAPGQTANAAVEFALSPREKDYNRSIHFNDLRLDGTFKTPILNRNQTRADVTGLPN